MFSKIDPRSLIWQYNLSAPCMCCGSDSGSDSSDPSQTGQVTLNTVSNSCKYKGICELQRNPLTDNVSRSSDDAIAVGLCQYGHVASGTDEMMIWDPQNPLSVTALQVWRFIRCQNKAKVYTSLCNQADNKLQQCKEKQTRWVTDKRNKQRTQTKINTARGFLEPVLKRYNW